MLTHENIWTRNLKETTRETMKTKESTWKETGGNT